MTFETPEKYAKHMASYISCPTTIRVRALEMFGRAPTIAQIEAMRPKQGRVPSYQKLDAIGPDKPVRPRLQAPVPIKKSARGPARKPQPPRLWPKWYDPFDSLGLFDHQRLMAELGRELNVSRTRILSRERDTYLVAARSAFAKMLRERGWTYPRIGRALGNRDHSTIINLVEKWPRYSEVPGVKEAYLRLRRPKSPAIEELGK